ncbi:MAG: hypothetical protein L7F78_11245 [Syntrophales bacterium LBB04]|nr:hypothetical protein [Syntrophales bacterium LBB04]
MKTGYMLNKECVSQLNMANGVSESQRQAVVRLFQESGAPNLVELIGHYLASMNQDLNSDWLAQKPAPPEIIKGKLPNEADEIVNIMGIGGMFAYLNVLYQAHKNGGRHSIVTNPRDIFTFSGWTVHPEEDMDQRLIEMFQTKSLFVNEVRHILGLSEKPQNIRYKAFRIDYGGMLALVPESPRELKKNLKVALHYSLLELTDTEKRYAKTNLKRNGATLRALEQMGLLGDDAGCHVANLCGRVVFEVEGEARIEWKNRLKEQFGLVGTHLTPSEVEATYGAGIPITDDIRAGKITPVRYRGGHFVIGHRENALNAAKEKNVLVYDNAIASRIIVDPEAGKHAVNIKLADGGERTVIADILLVALGDYGNDVITVDGVSTLFAIITENSRYRIHPTGMGEGGTIHVVPVWSVQAFKEGKTFYYHLGKATIGAIMGRNPLHPKSLDPDRAFLLHLEANLKRIAPPEATFLWIAATECGRPVSAYQGYSISPLLHQEERGKALQADHILNFKATGGCGLGGNTAIIPEVQEVLDRRSIQSKK